MGRDSAAPPLRLRVIQLRHRWRPILPWLLAALGVAFLVLGVVVLFTTEHDARSAFLLTLGLILTLLAVLGERIQLESLEFLGAKLQVREVVKGRLDLVESSNQDPAANQALRRQAIGLQRLAGLYEYIRRTEPPGPQRTRSL